MKLSEMDFEKSQKESVEQSAQELQNMSQDQLMEKLLQEVNKQKSNGNFDFDALKNTIMGMKNLLPEQSYENIMRIVDSLK